jgi:hypothetical protein
VPFRLARNKNRNQIFFGCLKDTDKIGSNWRVWDLRLDNVEGGKVDGCMWGEAVYFPLLHSSLKTINVKFKNKEWFPPYFCIENFANKSKTKIS